MTSQEIIENESYIQAFKIETGEQLDCLNNILLLLAADPNHQMEEINELFRLAHNIKGASGVMGLTDLKDAMHQLETVFGEVRQKNRVLDAENFDQLLQMGKYLLQYIENGNWSENQELRNWHSIMTQLDIPKAAPSQKDKPLKVTLEENQEITNWQDIGKAVYGIEANFDPDSAMKGAAAFVFMKYLEKYGIIYKTAPQADKLGSEDFAVFRAILMVEQPLEPEGEKDITGYANPDIRTVAIRKWAKRPVDEVRNKTDRRHPTDTIRVEYLKIDKLLGDVDDLFGIFANMRKSYQQGNQGFISWNEIGNLMEEMEHQIKTVQTDVLKLGMIPIKQLFGRFPLVVHDLAKKLDKEVEVEFYGEDTEIEKRVAEQLVDPLIHLVRNAVDHGLEEREERLRLEKPVAGHITIGAFQEGDRVVISVKDDGRGINPQKIREKAVKKGLIPVDTSLTDDETFKLIFQPGFSTVDNISDISGRGVGMDVVQNNIRALNGDIEIDSLVQKGTTFNLKVPMTQAVMEVFVTQIGDRLFGLPLDSVVESVMIEMDNIITGPDHLYYPWRGQEIILADVGELLGIGKNPLLTRKPMLILRNNHREMGFLVDDFIGQERMMIKPLNNLFSGITYISGIAKALNGEAVLMLDVNRIVSHIETQDTGRRLCVC